MDKKVLSIYIVSIFLTSFFIGQNFISNINISTKPLSDYVPVAIGDILWYNVSESHSKSPFSGSETTLSNWRFEVLGIGSETNLGINLKVNYSEYINNMLTESQLQVLFIPKSNDEFYSASPYIFATNQFFDMTMGNSERYFMAGRYGWQRNGTSFSESLCWGTHPLGSTFITYDGGILKHFEYKIWDLFYTTDLFKMDLIDAPERIT